MRVGFCAGAGEPGAGRGRRWQGWLCAARRRVASPCPGWRTCSRISAQGGSERGWRSGGLGGCWSGTGGGVGPVPPCCRRRPFPSTPRSCPLRPRPVPAPGAVWCLCAGLRLHGPSLGSGSWCRGEWMCHSLSSWQGTNDGRKALAVPGLPLPPLRCCRLLPAARIPACAAQPGLGAVGRTGTWGSRLRASHLPGRLGGSPVPQAKRRAPRGEERGHGAGAAAVLLPWPGCRAAVGPWPQPQRLSVPLSAAVTSCCVAGTPPAGPRGITGREGQPTGPSPSRHLGAGCLAG